MRKQIIYFILCWSSIQAFSCKKSNDDPTPVANGSNQMFNIMSSDSSLWLLKGWYYHDQDTTYLVQTYAQTCPQGSICNGYLVEGGFIIKNTPDTVSVWHGMSPPTKHYAENRYKIYNQYNNGTDNIDDQTIWVSRDSLFNGWPSGRSAHFLNYTVVYSSQDSLVVDDGTFWTQGPNLYSIYVNRSELLNRTN